jgi:methionine-rich copper-binding protein CopC
MMSRSIFLALWINLVVSGVACAHAFIDHTDPAAGGKVQKSPNEVRIWFTEEIEPAFSSIKVLDASGKQIDKGDTRADHANRALLHLSLPPLKAGTYKVVWRVVSVDTHVTKGDFTFQVVP